MILCTPLFTTHAECICMYMKKRSEILCLPSTTLYTTLSLLYFRISYIHWIYFEYSMIMWYVNLSAYEVLSLDLYILYLCTVQYTIIYSILYTPPLNIYPDGSKCYNIKLAEHNMNDKNWNTYMLFPEYVVVQLCGMNNFTWAIL